MNAKRSGRSLDDVLPTTTTAGDIVVDVTKTEPVIVPINMMVTPHDRQRLRQFKTDRGISLQKLGHRAWYMLLAEYGLPPLTPAPASVRDGKKNA